MLVKYIHSREDGCFYLSPALKRTVASLCVSDGSGDERVNKEDSEGKEKRDSGQGDRGMLLPLWVSAPGKILESLPTESLNGDGTGTALTALTSGPQPDN